MQMSVTDEPHVAHAHTVTHQLVLDHVLMELQAAHAKRFHYLVGALAGGGHDWVLPAKDQEAECKDTARAAAIMAQYQKARFQLDVAIVQNLYFQRHEFLPTDFYDLRR